MIFQNNSVCNEQCICYRRNKWIVNHVGLKIKDWLLDFYFSDAWNCAQKYCVSGYPHNLGGTNELALGITSHCGIITSKYNNNFLLYPQLVQKLKKEKKIDSTRKNYEMTEKENAVQIAGLFPVTKKKKYIKVMLSWPSHLVRSVS